MKKFRETVRFVRQMEEDIESMISAFDSIGAQGITELSYSDLMQVLEADYNCVVKFGGLRQSDGVEYLKTRFGNTFEVEGDPNEWMLLPMPPSNELPALAPRILNMIEMIATEANHQRFDRSDGDEDNDRSPIKVILQDPVPVELMSSNMALKTPTFKVCDFESTILKMKQVLEPIKVLTNKIRRNEVDIFDGSSGDENEEKMDIDEDTARGARIQTIAHAHGVKTARKIKTEDRVVKAKASWLPRDYVSARHPTRHFWTQKMERVKHEILDIISVETNGITSRDFYKKYRRRHGRDLRLKHWIFHSPLCMMKKLGLMHLVTRPFGPDGDFLFKIPASAFHVRVNEIIPDDFNPRNYFQFGDMLPMMPRNTCHPGQLMLVVVGGIFTPTDFHFMKYGLNHHIPLERMCREMNAYYNRQKPLPTLQRDTIRVDLFCAVRCENRWYRCVIMSVSNMKSIKVVHVDYGTEALVSVKDLRPLRREWAQLPMQAIRGRLHCLSPPAGTGGEWPVASTKVFHELVQSKPVFLQVVAMRFQSKIIPAADVIMIDTSGKTDEKINSKLVSMGLARWSRCGYRCSQHHSA